MEYVCRGFSIAAPKLAQDTSRVNECAGRFRQRARGRARIEPCRNFAAQIS